MDTPQQDKLLEDVRSVINDLPKPIASFLTNGSVESVAKTITQKNNLHIDQGAVIEKALMLTLMGIQEPTTLPKILKDDVSLDDETLNSILSDMNELVFTPLHESMKNPDTSPTPPPPPHVSPPPPPTSQTSPTEKPPIPLRPKDSHTLVKEYATDPYRESVNARKNN